MDTSTNKPPTGSDPLEHTPGGRERLLTVQGRIDSVERVIEQIEQELDKVLTGPQSTSWDRYAVARKAREAGAKYSDWLKRIQFKADAVEIAESWTLKAEAVKARRDLNLF